MDSYVIGVDLGGTKIAVLGSNKMGCKNAIMRVPSNLSDYRIKIEDTLIQALEKYIDEYEDGVRPAMVGFGLKDHVDTKNGIWYARPTKNGCVPMAFSDFVQRKCSLNSVLDNDVHAAALAEAAFGAGRKYRDFLYINIGTGLSMGAVIGGRLLRGASNYAGEIGHVTVETGGEPCDFCGKQGCLENIASGAAIIRQGMEYIQSAPDTVLARIYAQKGRIHSSDVFKAADLGDTGASAIAQRVLRALVIAATDMIHVFNPEAVIFGGGVMTDRWLIERLKKEIGSSTIQTDFQALKEITLSALGSDHVGVLGAIVLAEQQLASL